MGSEIISLKAWHGRQVCAEEGGGDQGQMVDGRPAGLATASRDWVGEWERFEATLHDDGTCSLRTVTSTPRYACVEQEADGSWSDRLVFNREAPGPWERFVPHRMSGNGVAFQFSADPELFVVAEGDRHTIRVRRPEPPGAPHEWETFEASSLGWLSNAGGGVGDSFVRLVSGRVRAEGTRWLDDSGPRSFRVCSWFPYFLEVHRNYDAAMRELDQVMRYWQGVRAFWHLGTPWWTDTGYGVPTSAPWFEAAFKRGLRELQQRGLRASLSTGDMQVLCPRGKDTTAERNWYRRIAQWAAEVDPHVVGWFGIWNEGWQNAATPTPEYAAELSRIVQDIYPGAAHGLSDRSEEHADLDSWSRPPSTMALVHGTRDWPWSMNRAFNVMYEWGRMAVNQDEPVGTGPHVTVPDHDPRHLFAVYTLHLITGQMTTYFGGHGLKSWTPDRGLDRDWGFTQLPELWARMAIPEDVQDWSLKAGHLGDAACYPESFEDPHGEGPWRHDGAQSGDRAWFVTSAGRGEWRLRSRWDGHVRVWTPDGVVHEQDVRAGERYFTERAPDLHAVVTEMHRR